MSILVTDTFDRADNADVGAAWTPSTTSFTISSNAAVPSSVSNDAAEMYTGSAWPNDQWSESTLVTPSGVLGAGCGVAVRGTGTTYYRFVGNGAGWEIGRFVSGSFTSISSGASPTFANGDTIYLQVVGTQLTGKKGTVNGQGGTTVFGPTTDANIASGSAGIAFSSGTVTTTGISSWQAGDFGGGKFHVFPDLVAQTSAATNPRTLTVTIEDESVLVVPVGTAGATARTGGNPTFNGITLSQAGTRQVAATSPESSAELFYLENPPRGSYTLSVPNAGTLTVRIAAILGRSSSGRSRFHLAWGNNATSTNPTANGTTTVNGCFVCAFLVGGHQDITLSTAALTSLFLIDHGTEGSAAQYSLQATAGNIVTSWTNATSEDWAIVAAAFEPVDRRVLLDEQRTYRVRPFAPPAARLKRG